MTKQSNAMASVLAQILRDSPENSRGDGELLSAFIDVRDPSAFAELVRRHGAMVLGVCHRVLRHTHDAEDAFQATFLVLARKAASISPPNAVGNWLYGVAHQTAIRARAAIMKRNARESLMTARPESAQREVGWDDLVVVLDEELTRLPNYYRAVIVLCDVEGRTRADAANHLGCPEGSVNSRLSRARAMLAKRLANRGVTLSTSSLALLITQNATSATVPAVLLQSTIEAVVAAVALSPTVTLLYQGVIRAMLIAKLKAIAAVVLAFGILGLTGVTSYRAVVGEEPGPQKATVKAGEVGKPIGNPAKVSAADERKKLQGRWKQIDVTLDGAVSDIHKRTAVHLVFDGERTWNEIGGIQKAPPQPFELHPEKDPKWIDFQFVKQDKPHKSFNIYSLDEKKLTLCLSTEENATEELRPKTFTGTAGTKQMLLVYERIPEFKAVGTLGAVRADDTAIPGIFDDTRPPYAAKPGKHSTEALAIKLLAANEKTILTDDRELLKKYYATSILATPGQRRTFDQVYVVVIYPKSGQPAKACATFEPGKLKTRDDALAEFGEPTDWEMLSEKWVVGHTHGAEGEILWWGDYGIRADAQGDITHILLRNPFGTMAAKRAMLADVVKEWTPALAGAKAMTTGGNLQDAQGKNLLPPRVATHFLEVTGVTFEDLWNDYATKCESMDRFKATTFLGAKWQGAEGKPSYLITDRETRIGERVAGFTCRKPGHTVAVTIQPKGDGKTILCTLVVVMDE